MQAKTILDLFGPVMWERMKVYAPPVDKSNRAKTISGRLLEETIELHLDSGGTPESAMSCVMDAIANESFKVRKIFSTNQAAYPSNFLSSYNRTGVVEELGDTLFVWIVNLITNQVTMEEVKNIIEGKLDKLEKARAEGKLLITESGKFYIQKD